jgi:hypothetical protein
VPAKAGEAVRMRRSARVFMEAPSFFVRTLRAAVRGSQGSGRREGGKRGIFAVPHDTVF